MSIVGIVGFMILRPFPMRLLAFLGGIAASIIVRSEAMRDFARKPVMSVLAVLCLCLTALQFPTAYSPVPLLFLSVAFIIVACGNTLFGALTSGCSRMLGDMSYSIYLLHGIVLFAVFRLLIGAERAAALTPAAHFSIAALCTPLVITISFITYRLIELPGMRQVPKLEAWLHGQLRWAPAPPG